MTAIRRGHVPQDMDDHWQAVFHGGAGNGDTYEDTAYVSLHRSWTGIEIFRVYFNSPNSSRTTMTTLRTKCCSRWRVPFQRKINVRRPNPSNELIVDAMI
jgi:hypothetical protein